MMARRGFDVQLHLHPQWLGARYKNGRFHVGTMQNLGRYEPERQRAILTESIAYLEQLLSPIRRDYKVIAFKAGCWGLQPSSPLLSTLVDVGVRIILGVRSGMYIPSEGLDYRSVEEPYLPYHPHLDDVTKVANEPNELWWFLCNRIM